MIDNLQDSTENKVLDIVLRKVEIAPDVLDPLRDEALEANVRLVDLLVDQQLISVDALVLAQSEYLNMPPMNLAGFSPEAGLIEVLPREILNNHLIFPISRVGRAVTVALGDPYDVVGLEKLRASSGLDILPVVAPEQQVQDLITRFRQDAAAGLEDILRDVEDSEIELSGGEADSATLEEMLEGAGGAPVIRIVNSVLLDAIRKKASDIHIEPMEKSLRIRLRIDGVLYEIPGPPKSMQNAIISRIKILSNLDIAERRIPQDGRLKIRVLGKECDVRVSTLPTVFGEKAVMRILDKSGLAPNVAALGLDPRAHEEFMYALRQPYGMILVTGPTGSGKTTTLYSCLQELNDSGTNIVTVEDPVEYQLGGVNQVQIHSDVGLTFASGLRSILRQDPDVVLVGEMRDGETASIGVQAALTGHLVLSTLHTNDAAGAVSRLMYMGIESFLLASSVLMTQAQRLYRKLCPACKKKAAFPDKILRANNINPELMEGCDFYEPRGCPKCSDTGYRGRAAIMEVLMVNDAIREAILKGEDSAGIRVIAKEQGMRSMREMGLEKVRAGETSIEEIIRVTSGE